jgi:hypothetical protein
MGLGVFMKKSHLYFALLLVAVFLTFSVVNIASAIPIETWDHKEVKKVSPEEHLRTSIPSTIDKEREIFLSQK